MKKLLPILLLMGGFSSPAMADIIHTISASTQLRVDAAATDATRIGSSYSVQGSNITAGTMGGLGLQSLVQVSQDTLMVFTQ